MDKTGFIKYLESTGIMSNTINKRVKYVEEFLTKTKKEDIQITKPDVLKFLEYLKNSRKVQNKHRYDYLKALSQYFTVLYDAGKIAENPCLLLKIRGTKRKILYKIYTSEELDLLFDNYYQYFVRSFDDSHLPNDFIRKLMAINHNRNALIVSILINQGVSTGEIFNIEISDLDLVKVTLKIRDRQYSNGRTLPLKATQIGLIINYLQNIRPQFLEYYATESNYLFLSIPDLGKIGKEKVYKDRLKLNDCLFYRLAKQIKMIDKQFFNFYQIRASVITNWLKTEGLRKAQYLAGHRHIDSTEKYVCNNLDSLIDDISKLHPFNF
jgi:integrase